MKCLLHRMSPKQLARWKRRRASLRKSDPPPGVDPSHVAVAFVDGAVGWFLRDPVVWRRLHELHVSSWRGPDGEWVTLGPLPIPPLPPGWGREWKTIFESVHRQFRGAFAAHGEGDIWISYALSYLALRSCALLGKHGEMAYVYRACINEHKRHHKRQANRRRRAESSDDLGVAEARHEAIDLTLDLEDVLRRLPAQDAAVCRLRLIEDRTFHEIGAALGIDASTAHRRYERSIGTIRAALQDYTDERPGTVPFVRGRGVSEWGRSAPKPTRAACAG